MQKYIYKNKLLFSLEIAFQVIDSILGVLFAFMLAFVIDAASSGNIQNLIYSIYLSIAFIILSAIIDNIVLYIRNKLNYKIEVALRNDVFKGILNKKITDFTKVSGGSYISIINNDIREIEDTYFPYYRAMFAVAIRFVISSAGLIFLDPLVAIICVLISAIPLITPLIFGKKLSKLEAIRSEFAGKFNEKVKELIDGFEIIKIFNIEKNALNIFKNSNTIRADKEYKLGILKGISNNVNQNIGTFAHLINIIVAGFFVVNGHITVGSILAIIQLSGSIIVPFTQSSAFLTGIKASKEIREKTLEIIESKDSKEREKSIDNVENIIVSNISLSLGDNKNILKNINFTFKKGKKYALVGESGSGKTTLIKTIMGYNDEYEGNIKIGKTEVKDINRENLYSKLAMVGQNVFVLEDSLKNNITLYNEYSNESYENVIKLANLEGVNLENSTNLSGGQKARIGIARALIKGAEALMMDETSASLDNETASLIENSLLELEQMIIFITHKYNKSILQKYDEILVMRDGKIIETGTFDTLYEEKGYFYSLYNLGN